MQSIVHKLGAPAAGSLLGSNLVEGSKAAVDGGSLAKLYEGGRSGSATCSPLGALLR